MDTDKYTVVHLLFMLYLLSRNCKINLIKRENSDQAV